MSVFQDPVFVVQVGVSVFDSELSEYLLLFMCLLVSEAILSEHDDMNIIVATLINQNLFFPSHL